MTAFPTDPLAIVKLLAPESILAAGIPLVLVVDLAAAKARQAVAAWLGVVVCAIAAIVATTVAPGRIEGIATVDGVVGLAKALVCGVTAIVLCAVASDERVEDRGAFTACALAVALGSAVAASAVNLLLLWLALETVSLASYALAAWKGGDRGAAEAGMKFVLFGGLASALTLFGTSHVYGLTGHLDFDGIGEALRELPPVAIAAIAVAGTGLAYKLTLVPFHFYAPDVYQGAPALSVATTSIAPKIGAVVAVAHLLGAVTPGSVGAAVTTGNAIAVVAGVSIVFASFTALAQRDGKRIVAFSGIAQAGTAVLALGCLPRTTALPAALFQLLAYAIANVGALVSLSVLESDRGSTSLAALRGAVRERPWVTAALCLFLFSLAGIPPLAGFLGKWAILQEVFATGLAEPARAPIAATGLLLVAATVLSAWSYLLVVRAVLFQGEELQLAARGRVRGGAVAVMVACGTLVLLVGLSMSWLPG